MTLLCSSPATNAEEDEKSSHEHHGNCTANSNPSCCIYRQRGRLASSGTSRRRRHSRCLDTRTRRPHNRHRPNTKRLATWDGRPGRRCRIFVPTRGISLTLLVPATIGAIHKLLVSCFADEERQRLDESRAVRARAVGAGAIVRQEIRVADVCAGFAAADLGTGLRLGLTPVEL